MCGRYVHPDAAAMERYYGLTARQLVPWIEKGLARSYNAAPTDSCPILRVVRDEGGERRVQPMRWGLIPYWANGVPLKASTINAMIETLDSKPTFRDAWRRSQHCVFPAAGFYEWQLQSNGTKIPHYVRPSGDDELFNIAGLWDRSITPDGTEVLSCTIITMPANEVMATIHNAKQRMPLILTKEDVETWLAGTIEQAKALLQPYPSELIRAYPVSTRVNTPKNNDASLIGVASPDS